MQHSSIWDDRLLALDVETALKALGIAAGEDEMRDGDLRLAVEDLRRPVPVAKRPVGDLDLLPPALLADDEAIFAIR